MTVAMNGPSKVVIAFVLFHTIVVAVILWISLAGSPELAGYFMVFWVLDFPVVFLELLVFYLVGSLFPNLPGGQVTANIFIAFTIAVIGGVWYYWIGRYVDRRGATSASQGDSAPSSK